ncbi:hypothetical protein GNI_123420 [Gregarina niphandrodes]|uniref:ISP1 C-terminal domain-containing protein n=1 Tax=Gregarina niphandrodes TaxID=110365 RepID=A0A023B2B4_GRENI|nr:hypothetical protein GNI_123420 [Gregarina niphandrodes]EZG51805.1 hypothetical protein GNI_123420 [Gregarina niphandrodes]|eukprot:XP_011131916.1 hypothetical protein GNI_123420 [Gregarina niphandrodes]
MGNTLATCCGSGPEDRNEFKTEKAPAGYSKRTSVDDLVGQHYATPIALETIASRLTKGCVPTRILPRLWTYALSRTHNLITTKDPTKGPTTTLPRYIFAKELENGVQVRITLGDFSRLPCDLHWSERERSLYIACTINGERRVRKLPLGSIEDLLYKEGDISSLEAAAGIKPKDECVALCLEEGGGGCLPLFFNDAPTKQRFIEFFLSRAGGQ